MDYNLVVKPLAEQDIEEAVKWYSKQAKHLPQQFIGKLEKALTTVQKHPEHYQKRYNEVRVIFTENFPFGIYYTLELDPVYIHAILHTKRNPRTGVERI